MTIRLYNTLTRSKDDFKPIEPGKVRLYTCGPTVYNFAHIGNLRTYVFEDVLKRVLTAGGFDVRHVMNVTDVGHLTSDADAGEDKMEKGAAREGKSVREIADFYWQAFRTDMGRLRLVEPTVWCKATDHIAEQIALIRTLEEKGFTYAIEDGVYFDTSRLPDYGKLPRLDVEGLQAGARVEMVAGKRNATDFALWKFSPKDKQRLMEWPSPWGVGFPGWHIECSAMALKYLGERVDIHCGGVDHIAVHHTNEIAQTEAALGHPWVNWWMHAAFLVIPNSQTGEAGKMSKSGGEFLKLDVLVAKGYDPLAYRLFCLGAHYRQQLAFTWDGLDRAKERLSRLKQVIPVMRRQYKEAEHRPDPGLMEKFMDAVEDDLDMPKALAVMNLIWKLPTSQASTGVLYATLLEMDKILGLGFRDIQEPDISQDFAERIAELTAQAKAARLSHGRSPEDLERELVDQKELEQTFQALGKDRKAARQAKDFPRADSVAKKLIESGVKWKDTPEGIKMWINDHDRIVVITSAIARTANVLGISKTDADSEDELLAKIKAANETAHQFLITFLRAWNEWFAFHRRIEEIGHQGRLTESENVELLERIRNRDESRFALISRLREIER